MNLLVIEDDRKLNRMLCEILEKEGYTVKACTDGEEGAYYLQQNAYDLALVDWMLPGESGPDILRESRRKGIMTPVVMLTALTAVENKVTCLDAGADDYLGKPFDSRERESILSIYSALFTYHSDTEKNNDILKNALQTSRRLGQLLSNMQDGMRSYFEELSQKKNFIGIQKVLVEEINNRDSKKYAILTTTDSFYRYKEAVKELISQILRENDQKREQLVKERTGLVEGTVTSKRNQYRLEYCESASQLVYQVEREFDLIEKKYNKLIEQKTVFAKRALARIHYILQEGSSDEDHIVKLINLLDHHANSPQVLEQMRDRIRVGTQFKNITDRSFYNRKNAEDAGFHPIAMEKHNEETQMTDFVPKPLYTKKQLQEFRQKNIVDGRFVTDEQTIQSVEDLEKLLFLWQEETDDTKQEETVHIDGELKGEYGFVFSKLVIDAKKKEKKNKC